MSNTENSVFEHRNYKVWLVTKGTKYEGLMRDIIKQGTGKTKCWCI